MFKICLCILLFIVLFIILIVSPVFRCFVMHPFKSLFYAIKDFILSIKYKSRNNCPTGKLDIYCGLFGRGKTLSMVHKVVGLYNRYNNKTVFDKERGLFVTQKIHILSNVDLVGVPYERLTSLQQIVECFEYWHDFDKVNNTLTVHIACIDELSVQMNSRNFKSNINASFLNTLLCCRHYHLSIFGTSQRFNHCDALLRQVTQHVIQCDKVWRFQKQSVYDAYELENCTNVLSVRPLYSLCWFVRDFDYNNYNTYAVVENLTKSWAEGDLLDEETILNLQEYTPKDNQKEKKKGLFARK